MVITDGKGLAMQSLQKQLLQHEKWWQGRGVDTLRVRDRRRKRRKRDGYVEDRIRVISV